jgi:hypothetical protein
MHQHQRIQGLIQQTTCLKIGELPVEVGTGNGQIMLALTIVSRS